jgi:6-phosphogluconolactonase
MGHDIFLRTIPIPEENIHRIKGEANPEDEAQRYAEEIRSIVPLGSPGFPRFDWIFLGLGSDGHTASLFPGSSAFEEKESICVAAEHPLTGQNRITLTLPVINSAARVSFLVSGIEKSGIVARILGDQGKGPLLPASKVSPQDGLFEWYLDRQAASMIRE